MTETMFSPVVELRQYTLKPQRRDDLIRLFETHFLEGQEKFGMQIIGQFRDRQNPDRFVWLRGFDDMAARQRALEGFYTGPIWQAHRSEANDTMLDSDNVLLFRPAPTSAGFYLTPSSRPGMDTEPQPDSVLCASLYYFPRQVDSSFLSYFKSEMKPLLQQAGAVIRAQLVTEPSKNTFPRLPVREGENVFMWVASFADEAAYTRYRSALDNDRKWSGQILPKLQNETTGTETIELSPCRRSLLR